MVGKACLYSLRNHRIYLSKSDMRKCYIYLEKLCAQINTFTLEICARKMNHILSIMCANVMPPGHKLTSLYSVID